MMQPHDLPASGKAEVAIAMPRPPVAKWPDSSRFLNKGSFDGIGRNRAAPPKQAMAAAAHRLSRSRVCEALLSATDRCAIPADTAATNRAIGAPHGDISELTVYEAGDIG
jgi:hypothetical protein